MTARGMQGLDRGEVQRQLFRTYGVPRQVTPDVADNGIGLVRVYAVVSREAADAWVLVDEALWGNRARAELRESVGWCVVVDVTDRVSAAIEAQFQAGE